MGAESHFLYDYGKPMTSVLLLQLPIPQLNFARLTGNVPFGAAYLKQAAARIKQTRVDILPESITAYLADEALLRIIIDRRPDIVGFTVYCWNLDRSLYMARKLKEAYGPRIIFGGPEITPDNRRAAADAVDFRVFGEGEAVFLKLLQDPSFWRCNHAAASADNIFEKGPNPYLADLLEPEIEDMLLVETQRGCPYHCSYCYYNKSRDRLSFADTDSILKAIRWARERNIAEIYLLDPSLNTRPDLKTLLDNIADLNTDRRLSLVSEIRAEAIDARLADSLARAGFSWFEIGLQSTNPAALKRMHRPTNLKLFSAGIRHLKQAGILPRIDLIAGLPDDDLTGFKASVDFLKTNDLIDDVQVFPLSVLPGTEFRSRSGQLGLIYSDHPPYTVTRVPGFTPEELLLAIDYAEVQLDLALFPMPDLDIAWRRTDKITNARTSQHVAAKAGPQRWVSRLVLSGPLTSAQIEHLAAKLTHPYQIHIHRGAFEAEFIDRMLRRLTAANPFTPFEMVFFEPPRLPDTNRLLAAIALQRPHFLDIEQRFLFPEPGNRAVLFTLVSQRKDLRFNAEMQRQVYWWQHSRMPDATDLEELSNLDGVLIDTTDSQKRVREWQDTFSQKVEQLPHIGFADIFQQIRWFSLTAATDYYLTMLRTLQ